MSPERPASATGGSGRHVVASAPGVMLILAWGSSYYLPAALAGPSAEDTGWPLAWVASGLSLGAPRLRPLRPLVGRTVQRHDGRTVLAASSLLLSLGLVALAAAPSLAAFLLAWVVVGAGMSTGLDDAAFAAMGASTARTRADPSPPSRSGPASPARSAGP